MKTIKYIDATYSTGTLTVVDYTQLTGGSVTINAVEITEGVDWTAGTSNEDTAESIASAINANVSISAECTAEADGAVVTLTAVNSGVVDVAIGTSDDVNLQRSGPQLEGGADAEPAAGIVFTGPGHIKSITVAADSASDNTVQVLNGQDSEGVEYDLITGVDSQTVVRTYKTGLFLPNGCYVVGDTAVQTIAIEYQTI